MAKNTSSDIALQIRQNADEFRDYLADLSNWQKDIQTKEKVEQKKYARSYAPPPVRSSTIPEKNDTNENLVPERLKSSDYRAWDKFDVDKACEQIDKQEDNVVLTEQSSSTVQDRIITADDVEKAAIEKEKGNVHFKKGDYRKALICYTKAIGIDFENPILFTNRAMALIKMERWQDAIQDCTAAISMDNKAVKAYWRRGIARRELGELKDALEDLRMANVLDPLNKSIRDDYKVVQEKLKPPKKQENVPTEELPPLETVPVTKRPHPAVIQPVKDTKPLASSSVPKQGVTARRRLQVREIGKPEDYVAAPAPYKPIIPSNSIGDIQIFDKNPDETVDTLVELKEVKTKILTKPSPAITVIDESETKPVETKPLIQPIAAETPKRKMIIEEIEVPKPVNAPEPVQSTPKPSSIMIRDPPKSMVDFERDWKSLIRHPESLYHYLKSIDPKRFPVLLKSSFESTYLTKMSEIISEYYLKDNLHQEALDVLENLSKTPRFDMNVMFLSKKEKLVFVSLFGALERVLDNDLAGLRKKYGLAQ